MNQFISFLLVGLLSLTSTFTQKEEVLITYHSDLPFQTVNDTEYYHLESTLMIRKILSDMVTVIEKKENNNRDVEFTILIKNDYGAVLPINYLVQAKPYSSEASKNLFMKI